MKIKVTWFKATGKMLATGLVEVGTSQIWEPEFKQAIVDNQNELVDNWVNNGHYVMADSTESQDKDPEFKGFYTHLFLPDAFQGMTKQ